MQTPGFRFSGKSHLDSELKEHPDWEVDYIAAPPQMAKYIKYSTRIYAIYLTYIAPEDIHVYPIDEVFIGSCDYAEDTLEISGLVFSEAQEVTGFIEDTFYVLDESMFG